MTAWKGKWEKVNNRILSAISLCKKAGKLTLGFDAVKKAVEDKSAKLLVLAGDLSPKTHKEIQRVASLGQVRVVKIDHTMEEIWMQVNKRAGVLAICDEGFAQMLLRLVPEENKEDTIL